MLREALVVTVLSLTPTVGAAQSIEGVWRLVEFEVVGGDNPRVRGDTTIQPSFLFFTQSYFTYIVDSATGPRPLPADLASAEEVMDLVHSPYTVGAGTYGFTGDRLYYYRVTTDAVTGSLPENQPLLRFVSMLTEHRLETHAAPNAETGAYTLYRYARVE